MKQLKFLILFPLSIFLAGCAESTAQQGQGYTLKLIAKGFMGPTVMETPDDGSGRIFICEQTGKIKIIKNGKVNARPFLDLKNKMDNINSFYSEKGLLGLAFHPQYKTNGRFFVYYSAQLKKKGMDHKSILAEFKVSVNADSALLSSEKILLEIEEPEFNHNGGQLAFGPDGYLYIGSGDGGGGGDEHGTTGNGQNLQTLLGKILRIDVNSNAPYAIPKDNPFVNDKNVRPEIWAYGLRNPWRFSFDKKTGKLFCADVGQNKWEEIDIIEKGKNYGWRLKEGNHCYNPGTNCEQKNLVDPIAEYGHKDGISVTGGYVYRGKAIPELTGKYIFGDWKGNMFYLEETGGKWQLKNFPIAKKNNNDFGQNINSFGVDENGEIYVLVQKNTGTITANGEVYLITK